MKFNWDRVNLTPLTVPSSLRQSNNNLEICEQPSATNVTVTVTVTGTGAASTITSQIGQI